MGRVVRERTNAAEGLNNLLSAQKQSSKVGWFESAKYPDGTPVAYVAAIQELGSTKNNIPPRSFMRTTISSKSGDWKKLAESGARAVLAGNASPADVIMGLGLAAEGDIRKTIAEMSAPALKESTIKNRLRKMANGKKVGNLNKPLVETGLMIATLTSVVITQ
tara:strand:+ start:746 stop:1234 length:489 start_codon:yes stop_codon:yes gene_type:complete